MLVSGEGSFSSVFSGHVICAIFSCEARISTSQENTGICDQWWEVNPSLTIFEVCGDLEGVISSSGAVVNGRAGPPFS